MQGKVEICGVNTARLQVLSQVEMDALLRRAKEGDEKAREKLIEQPIRMIRINRRHITWLHFANKHLRLITSLPSILIEELLMLCVHLPAHQAADNQQ